jgi:mannan endo-1,4-beta-mannosidase
MQSRMPSCWRPILWALAISWGSWSFAQPATRPFVSSQPDVPYKAKPAHQDPKWLVEHEPVNPNATPEARALLKFLYAISNKHTLLGQHNYPGHLGYYTQMSADIYCKTPSMYGTDWGFAAAGDKDTAYTRRELVQELIARHRDGAIIALCWHQVRPTDDEPVTFRDSVQGKLTDAEWEQLLTPGSPLNKHWTAQVDVIAEYLKQLQDARVPILWRPLHEINGNWFWWNGRRGERGTVTLFRMMYDRLTNFHKLNNLIWVWNPDQPATPDRQFVDFFPGHDVVDVLSFDCCGTFQQSFYNDLNALSDGKPMAISETGNLPMPELYESQPKWTYVMRWSFAPELGERPRPPSTRPATRQGRRPQGPTREQLAEMARHPRMLSLEDQAYWDVLKEYRQAMGLSADRLPKWSSAPTAPTTQPAANP